MKMRIYVRINGKTKTGGPKALLQLAEILKLTENEVSIIYDNIESELIFREWHSSILGPTISSFTSDNIQPKNSIIIFSETNFDIIKDDSNRYWLYMLSIDNCNVLGFPPATFESKIRYYKNQFKNLPNSWNNRITKYSSRIELILTQSAYANDIIGKSRISIPYYYIGDYIDFSIRKTELSFPEKVKKLKDLKIAFNPKKGKFLSFIAKNLLSIKLTPLENLKPEEIPVFLKSMDLYIDFGGQPGKDRIPREALANGIPVLIARRGSAVNGSDFPINSFAKFGIFKIIFLRKIIRAALEKNSTISMAVLRAEIDSEKQIMICKINSLLKLLKR